MIRIALALWLLRLARLVLPVDHPGRDHLAEAERKIRAVIIRR